MNKRYIEWVVIFVLSAMLVLGGSWLYSRYKQGSDIRGKYTFAQTKEKINYLGNIKIISQESGEMNFYRLSDGSWRFKEAKDYFVSDEMLSFFFNMVKNSIILSVRKSDNDFVEKNNLTADKGTVVQTYDYDGNLLDNIILGNKSNVPELFWSRNAGNEQYAYEISAINGFSSSVQNWVPYPLLSIKTDEIKWISINGEKTDYKEFNRLLKRSSAWRDLVRALNFLDYYGVDFKSDFVNLPQDTKVRQIDVGMLNGMIYKLTLLDTADAYWIVISMDADRVFLVDAVDVAANTYRYYADWVFRLSDEQGTILFSNSLFY